jgi:hypothetical protein
MPFDLRFCFLAGHAGSRRITGYRGLAAAYGAQVAGSSMNTESDARAGRSVPRPTRPPSTSRSRGQLGVKITGVIRTLPGRAAGLGTHQWGCQASGVADHGIPVTDMSG